MEKIVDVNVGEMLLNEASNGKSASTIMKGNPIRMDDETNGTNKFNELQLLLKRFLPVPEDVNEAFVLNYKVSEKDAIKFNYMVSSKKLLSSAVGQKIMSADTTYKIQNFPVSPIGTVDKNRHFGLIALGVSTDANEDDFTFFFETIKNRVMEVLNTELKRKIILCDGNTAISNGFLSVFEDAKQDISSSSNALESFKCAFNQEMIMNKHLPHTEFFNQLCEWMNNYSVKYDCVNINNP